MQCEPLVRLLKDPIIKAISLVGGGGKSGLIYWISKLALQLSIELIVTTTTKMRFSEVEVIGDVIYEKDLAISSLAPKLRERKVLVILKDHLGEKVVGIESGLVDSLKRNLAHVKILVEADGSKGMPIKANLDHEPVVPHSTDVLIGVVGLDALHKPLEKVVFREEEFMRSYGLKRGQILDWEIILRHVNSPKGLFKGAPRHCIKILFFNKADLFQKATQEWLAHGIKKLNFQVDEILLGSVLKHEMVSLGKADEGSTG